MAGKPYLFKGGWRAMKLLEVKVAGEPGSEFMAGECIYSFFHCSS